MTRHKRWRVRIAGVLPAAVMLLTACGNEAESGGESWRDTDVCSLISAEEIASYLGGKTPSAQRKDAAGGLVCLWEADPNLARFELTLWQPPEPRILTDKPQRVLDVSGKKGYVSLGTAQACHVDVSATPAWVQVEARSPRGPEVDLTNENAMCDKVTGTLKAVFDKLGW